MEIIFLKLKYHHLPQVIAKPNCNFFQKVFKKVSKQPNVNQYLFNKLKREKIGKNLNKYFRKNSMKKHFKIRKRKCNF